MTKVNKGLGRGLSALFSEGDEQYSPLGADGEKIADVLELDINDVYPNPNQPRKTFDEAALRELADSISEHGVIMPIVVSKTEGDRFMIIAGERRWRASRLAGKTTIPAIVKKYSEKQIKEVSLIENLQREDLNPIEAALAMRRLMEDYGMTQENLSEINHKTAFLCAACTRKRCIAGTDKENTAELKQKIPAGTGKTEGKINKYD